MPLPDAPNTWTDNAGITRPILNRNAFDIERARLTIRGYAVDPRLTYFLQMDGDTDGFHTVDFFDYWWAWQLTIAFRFRWESARFQRVVNGCWGQG